MTEADLTKVRIHNRGNPLSLPGRRHTGKRIETLTTPQHRGKADLSDRVCVGLRIEHGDHIDLPRWYVEELKNEPGFARLLAARALVETAVDEAPPPRDSAGARTHAANKAREAENAANIAAVNAKLFDANARIAELEAQLDAGPKPGAKAKG